MGDFQQERALIKNRVRRRGIYLLPNLFTTAALFAGFYAIVQAMNGRFDQAAIAIFVAMVLDSLDGRVARLTKTQSAFGAEYDSLSDMVSFGAAPALIVYEWSLRGMGKLGWIAAFVYVAGAALRLARFNTMLEVADKRYFQGLPSPAAAALVAGFVWIVDDNAIDPESVRWVAWAVTVFAGPDDGQQSQVLQLQDDQPPTQRAVSGRIFDRAVLRAGQLSAGDRSVRRLCHLCPVRLRLVGLAGAQTPPRLIALASAPAGRRAFSRRAAAVAQCRKSGYSRFMSSLARAFAPLAPIAILGGLLLLRPARR